MAAATCPPKPPVEKEWILVCNSWPDPDGSHPENARLAASYCPSHLGEYIKGRGPTKICDIAEHQIPPPPPVPVCDIPWSDKRIFLGWDGALLCFLSSKHFTREEVVAYANALAEDGIPLTRSFSYFVDEIPGVWESWKPVDAEYRPVVQERLKLLADRKITMIVSLEPYGAFAPDSDLEWIIETCRPFFPWIIFETANESGDMNLHRRLVGKLKTAGVPSSSIMIYYTDSGDFADCLQVELAGEGLASLHGVGSMETILAPWPAGWAESPGTLALMKIGLRSSNDGEDVEHAAKGLFWPWLPDGLGRRSTAAQGHEIAGWMLVRGGGFEFLSAAGFQGSNRPDLSKAVDLGREERRALRAAYDEVFK